MPPLPRLMVAFALWTGAAAADDQADLQACLDGGEPATAYGRCVDLIAGPCLGAPGAETTPAMAECYTREAKAWDAALNRQWPVAMHNAKAAAPAADAALLRAQRAWIAFRDADCAAERASYGDGSLGVVAFAACQRDHTAHRVVEFTIRLQRLP